MQLRLDDVDFADGDELTAVQAATEADNALIQALHPGLSLGDTIAALKERWASVYGFSPWYHKKVVDVDTGAIVAYARWGLDDEHRKDLPSATGFPEGMTIPPRQKPASLNFELAGQLGQQSDPISERALHGRPSLFFDKFGVLPEYRQHGAAQLLFAWAKAFADKAGIVCYSESGLHNAELHLQNGFEKVGVIELKDKEERFTLEAFAREPRKHSA